MSSAEKSPDVAAQGAQGGRHPFASIAFYEVDGQRTRIVTLDPGFGSANEALKQSAASNRILGSLGEPRILQASHVEHRDGRFVMVTEGTSAVPLAKMMSGSDAALSLRAIVHVLIEVCEALDAAHGLGVIHGALTPFGVLVDGKAEEPTVYVTDFGLGHVIKGDRAGEGEACWLPFAPERLMGEDPVPATDVYLVGALGYALLRGRPVFEGGSFEIVQRSHSIEEPPALHRGGANAHVPEALSDLIARCLVKEPEDRFARPGDLAAALRHFARVTWPTGPTSVPVMRAEPEPHELWDGSADGEPSDIDEEAATRLMTRRDELQLLSPPPTPKKRSSRAWVVAVGLLVVAAAGGGAYLVTQGGLGAWVGERGSSPKAHRLPSVEAAAPEEAEPAVTPSRLAEPETKEEESKDRKPGKRKPRRQTEDHGNDSSFVEDEPIGAPPAPAPAGARAEEVPLESAPEEGSPDQDVPAKGVPAGTGGEAPPVTPGLPPRVAGDGAPPNVASVSP